MLKTKLAGAGTAILLAGAVGLVPAAASASAAPAARAVAPAAQPAATTLPVTGTLSGNTAFTGSLSNLTASVVNGVVQLSGTITGTNLPAGGTTFTAPLQGVTATRGCSILNLDLGPLNLDLLGLVIDLALCPWTSPQSRVPASSWATCCVPWPACWMGLAAHSAVSPRCSTSCSPVSASERREPDVVVASCVPSPAGRRCHPGRPGCHPARTRWRLVMTVIAFRPRPGRAGLRHPDGGGVAITGTFRSPCGRSGTMTGSLRLQRLVIVPRGAFVTGVFAGELREPDGTLVGVDSRRASAPADLVRDDRGLRPVVRPLQLDLMGIMIDVDSFAIEPSLAFPRGERSTGRRTRGAPACPTSLAAASSPAIPLALKPTLSRRPATHGHRCVPRRHLLPSRSLPGS